MISNLYRTLNLNLIFEVNDLLNWDDGSIVNFTEVSIDVMKLIDEAIDEILADTQIDQDTRDTLLDTTGVIDTFVEFVFGQFRNFNETAAFDKDLFDAFNTRIDELQTYVNDNLDDANKEKMDHVINNEINPAKASAAAYEAQVLTVHPHKSNNLCKI